MVARLLITSALFLVAAGYRAYQLEAETIPARPSLETIPLRLSAWQGRNEPQFEQQILNKLGVDEYIMRTYVSSSQPPVGLYVGFYQSQRQGDTIHSPLNCLPGAGWQPVQQGRATFAVQDANGQPQSITVNEFTIQKGLDRQVVLYWYQSHGRVVASEYSSKMLMIADAIRLNRTDAALVRVITPIAGDTEAQKRAAQERARQFVQQIFPVLSTVVPS
jgi:EpsI family protein